MLKRTESLASRLVREMFTNEMRCEHGCGVSFASLSGKPTPMAQYLCHRCRRPMCVTVTQVRSEEEARFNLRWTGVFRDRCPCGATVNHRVEERPDMAEGVHFLVCGSCGEELREVEAGELTESSEKPEETEEN